MQGKYYVYKESGVKIARSARIGHGVVFGKGTVVEDDAEINHSTIGRNCVIGRGVRIQESHLYDGLTDFLFLSSHTHSLSLSDVIAEANSTISYSIIGENSVVKSGSTISRFALVSLLHITISARGCVLSSNVVVGSNVIISPFTRIGSCKHPDEEVSLTWLSCSHLPQASEGEDEDDDEENSKPETLVQYDTVTLGAEGVGYVWKYGTEGLCSHLIPSLNLLF